MAVSSHLFDLIKALTKQEKRYFKLYSSKFNKSKDNNYTRLFEAIDKQKHYDEKALKRVFKGETFVKQFHVAKNYLYHLILEALQAYGGGQTVNQQIQEAYEKSQILYEKGLYEQALRLLKKAEKLSKTYEKFDWLLKVYKQLKLLYTRKLAVNENEHYTNLYLQLEQNTMRQFRNLWEYEWISNEIFNLYFKVNAAKNPNEKAAYQKLMVHPLLENESKALSFRAKVFHFNIQAVCFEAIGEKRLCCQFRADTVALFEENPHFIEESLLNYIVVLNNLIVMLATLKEYEAFDKHFQQLLQIPQLVKRKLNDEESVMFFRSRWSAQLQVLVQKKEFEQAIELSHEIEKEFKRLGSSLNKAYKRPMYYFFAYCHFSVGNYRESLSYLEHLVHEDDVSFKLDLFRFGRMLYLLNHYELDNLELLPFLVRSTQRYLQKLGEAYLMEHILLQFLKEVPHTNERQAFMNLQEKLQFLAEEDKYESVLHHLDVLAWIRAKLIT